MPLVALWLDAAAAPVRINCLPGAFRLWLASVAVDDLPNLETLLDNITLFCILQTFPDHIPCDHAALTLGILELRFCCGLERYALRFLPTQRRPAS
jgi:hypothetical protein